MPLSSCSAVRRRSSAWVQLVAALVGLVVGHWGWRGAAAALLLPKFPGDDDDGWLHQSVVGYTLSRRVLPIVLMEALCDKDDGSTKYAKFPKSKLCKSLSRFPKSNTLTELKMYPS